MVAMITAWLTDTWLVWPTAVQRSALLQAMPEREPTVGGMTWGFHLTPPSAVVITAAPLGAPPPPTVEPTAQHLAPLTQSTASRELTGDGRPTAVNVPTHGELVPNVDGGGAASGVVHPAAITTMNAATVTAAPPRHPVGSRRGEGALTSRRGELSGP
jgi:hypothetical protein